MSFDFWSAVNSAEFQNQAVAENESAGGGFKKFTENGEYNLTIKNAEMRQTRAGYQKLTLRVQADSGESGFWDLLVGHGGGTSTAAKIAQQSLAMILKYSGAKAANPSALIGLRVKTWVKMEEQDGYDPSPRFRPIGPAEGATKPVAKNPAAKPAASKPAAEKAPAKTVSQQDIEDAEFSDDDIPF
jgi:hypothetical protein|nr:MAG TPA: hypothetical protein [Caudoviricetes sp.]